MDAVTRQTLRNGVVGGVLGTALGYVPLVLLVAPLVGGGVAGYLEREGPRRGALAGAVAGVVMAAVGAVVTGVVLAVRFGSLPTDGSLLPGLGVAALLSLVATAGQVVVAAVGGGLGGLLAADRRAPTRETALAGGGRRRWLAAGAALVAGVGVFLVVAVALTAALDPLIWPSALVGLPAGFLAGVSVAVVGYRYLTRGSDDTVNWRNVGVAALAVAVVFALAIGGLWALGQQRVAETTDSTYEYRVTIATDRSLENATFYVPAPTDDGPANLTGRFVADVTYDRDTPAIRGYDPDPTPVNFTYATVETEHGRLLAISADRVTVSRVYYREVENATMGWRERIDPAEYDPEDPSMGVRDDGSFTFTVTVAADEEIETADPAGAEPLLVPRYDRTAVDCDYSLTDTHRCFTYESRVYARYDAAPDATVYVRTDLSGRNEWFSGGWTGNEYRQDAAVELRGPGTGWYVAPGTLEVGSGRYRS